MQERQFLREHLQTPETPPQLEEHIWAQIRQSTLRHIWIEASLAFFATLSLTSYALWSWQSIQQEIHASSLVPFVQLLISNPDIASANLGEATWGIMETVPMYSIVFGLILLLSLICTLGFAFRLRKLHHHFSLQLT